jgi:uncharacterized protein DUF3987
MTAENNIISFPSLREPDAWDTPILFDEAETPEISAQWLPGIFGEFAAALSLATETPEALSVMTVLGVLSAVAMQRVVVSPQDHWREPINIYTLIALPPANHKSLVLKSCLQPVIDWEKAQAQQLGTEIKRLRSERKSQEKRIEVLRTKAAKAKSQWEYLQLTNEVTQQETELVEIPVAPQLFVNDVTPESLANTLYEQGGRLGIFSDEGGIFETLAGLYSQGTANIDVLLKGIDGGSVRVRRKERSFSLNPYLTVVLAVQPAVVRHLTEKKAYAGNGALERFLYVLPRSKLGYRTHATPAVSEVLRQSYQDRITQLLNLFVLPENKSSSPTPLVLMLTAAAQSAWRAYQAAVELQLRPAGQFTGCSGWAGKMPGFALRLAGLLHVAEQSTESLMISERTMQNALALAEALGYHALAAFDLMGVNEATEDARFIFRWIKTLTQMTFIQSELTVACRHQHWVSERLTRAIRVLQERHLISQSIVQPGRFKPTKIYFIHPSLVNAK